MRNGRIVSFFVLLIAGGFFFLAYSESRGIGKIVAYPNPFDPDTQTLTIKPAASSVFDGSVTFTVYDFNQKEVYSGQTVTNSTIQWSGHGNNGSRVSPGLYFIKLYQVFSDAAVGQKFIKVLVH